jgi:hypothetical protein
VIDEYEHDHDPDDRRFDRAALSGINYRRWTRAMTALSSAMWELPRRSGASGPNTHDLGIDRLQQSNIRSCLDLMCRFGDEFDYRPTAAEVERIGRELVLMKPSLDNIRRDHRRVRREEADQGRNQTPRLRRGPRAGG